MTDNTKKLEKTSAGSPATDDTKSAKPIAIPVVDGDDPISEKELHAHDHGSQNLEQNHLAEQQVKNQQNKQNDREQFPKGLAQEHGKGHG
jgi:hypothetical protein